MGSSLARMEGASEPALKKTKPNKKSLPEFDVGSECDSDDNNDLFNVLIAAIKHTKPKLASRNSSSYKGREINSPIPLAPIEQLPVEILEKIAWHCHEPRLWNASKTLTGNLPPRNKLIFDVLVNAFCNNDFRLKHPDAMPWRLSRSKSLSNSEGLRYDERLALQKSLLDQRWCGSKVLKRAAKSLTRSWITENFFSKTHVCDHAFEQEEVMWIEHEDIAKVHGAQIEGYDEDHDMIALELHCAVKVGISYIKWPDADDFDDDDAFQSTMMQVVKPACTFQVVYVPERALTGRIKGSKLEFLVWLRNCWDPNTYAYIGALSYSEPAMTAALMRTFRTHDEDALRVLLTVYRQRGPGNGERRSLPSEYFTLVAQAGNWNILRVLIECDESGYLESGAEKIVVRAAKGSSGTARALREWARTPNDGGAVRRTKHLDANEAFVKMHYDLSDLPCQCCIQFEEESSEKAAVETKGTNDEDDSKDVGIACES